MKNLLFLYILSLFSFFDEATAQDYFPFPSDSSKWSEVRQVFGTDAGTSVVLNYSYRTSGDTTIGNNLFKVVELQHEWSYTYHAVFGTNITFNDFLYRPVGAVREEDKKVFFYDFGLTTGYLDSAFDHLTPNAENLIYDFNINLGDTLFWKPYGPYEFSVLYSIDSITLENGQVRKKYNFIADGIIRDSWIEGIGSNQGLLGSFNTILPYDYAPYLLCFTENNEFLYNDTTFFDGCETDFNISAEEEPEEEPEEEALKIYPNPFNANLIVTNNLKDFPQIKINIYSITGALFKSFIITDKLDIETNNFASGIYFIQILDSENNMLLEKKILKL